MKRIFLAVLIAGVFFNIEIATQVAGQEIIALPDKSRVELESVGEQSVEYHYISLRSGKQCGVLQDFKYTGIYAYAFPTQWWNYTFFRLDHPTREQAVRQMERYCPTK